MYTTIHPKLFTYVQYSRMNHCQELTSILNHSWQKAKQIVQEDMKDYVVFHGDAKEC